MSPRDHGILQYLNCSINTACLVGCAIALYSFLVEINVEQNPSYVAMCDISEHISCTKAFSSEYGRGFGIVGKIFGEKSRLNLPNGIYGMAFYTVILFINMVNKRVSTHIMICLTAISNAVSLYLASILIFILNDFCIVCISSYFINATLLFLAMWKKHSLTQRSHEKVS